MYVICKNYYTRRSKDYGRTCKAGGETRKGELSVKGDFLFGSLYVVSSALYGSD